MKNKDLIKGTDGKKRCKWCTNDPLYTHYHDNEWGRPVYDDVRLFEKICLEGFQAGLSWITILRKRENFRKAFDNFDIHKIAKYTEKDVENLLQNEGIIRHRGKIEATINNAQRALELEMPLNEYLWSFKPPEKQAPKSMADIPTDTPESHALSKDLKKRGWKFVGPTTMYALMQAMGMVNDHLEECDFRKSNG